MQHIKQVDVAFDDEANEAAALAAFIAASPEGISLKVVEAQGPTGWALVEVAADTKARLDSWLTEHGYEDLID